MVNAILWIARSGAPWRDLPERFDPWETVYTRFRELIDGGTLVQIFRDLNVDADLQDMSLDSTSVKVHQHAAGAKKGRNQ
ncbi:MAG: transposase [Oscillospiraceae bacterium]|nr:transposase [Oscillospiraceae bacterium]